MPKKTTEDNGTSKVIVTPQEFVLAWQESDTIEAVSERLGMNKMSVRQRAYSYRRKGVPLKSMRASANKVDWESLKALAAASAPSTTIN